MNLGRALREKLAAQCVPPALRPPDLWALEQICLLRGGHVTHSRAEGAWTGTSKEYGVGVGTRVTTILVCSGLRGFLGLLVLKVG